MRVTTIVSRFVIFVVVVLSLICGLGSRLARLGWQMDSLSQNWILLQGPLMNSGFLGSCVGFALLLAKLLLKADSLGLLILFALMLRLHPSRDMAVMAAAL